MKRIIQIFSSAFVLSILGVANAQQDPQFTQYFDNTIYVNPAYAGSNEFLNVTAIHREQWVGFDGHPRSTSFSMHSPLSYESVGVGLSFVNDQIGPLKQNMIYADFSYTLKFKNPKNKLSFGAKAGMNFINIGSTNLVTTESNDPKLISNIFNRMNPNFGAGVYYHTPRFFVGLSSPRLLQRSYDGLDDRNIEQRHYFGILGGVFKLNPTWKIRPTAQLKLTNNAPISVDVSAAGIYMDKLWIGAMYRLNAAVGAFLQYQLSDQLKVGIASDFGTQAIKNYNNGTYELMLSYDFRFKREGVRSPRYF